eukprot:9194187-Karenia_brevis.AAC.1
MHTEHEEGDEQYRLKAAVQNNSTFRILSWNCSGINELQLDAALDELKVDGVKWDAICLQEA